MINFVYTTKEEFLKHIQESKDQENSNSINESSTTSQNDVESSDSKQ